MSVNQIAQAASQAVVLSSFTATSAANETVRIDFETDSESDISHWLIKRSTSPTGFIPSTASNWMDDVITIKLNGVATQQIPATGASASGAAYVVFDEDPTLTTGQTWWYTVVEVQQSNGIAINHDADFKDDVVIGDTSTPNVDISWVTTGTVVAPGGSTSHVVRVTNTGNDATNVNFRIRILQSTPDGWSYDINGSSSLYSIPDPINPGDTKDLTLNVTAPLTMDTAVSNAQLQVEFASTAITVTDVVNVFSQIGSRVSIPIILK